MTPLSPPLRIFRRLPLLTLLALVVWLPVQASQAKPVPKPQLTDRVVVMGASLSAGLGLCKELEVATPFARLVDAALPQRGTDTLNLGYNPFFLSPEHNGRFLMDQAVAYEPTLVFAADFLFWYGMSFRWRGPEDRLRGLEAGLKQLERLSCPIIIGDYPDVRRALNGRHEVLKGPIVFPSMIPDESTRAAMNQRVREWAAGRTNVLLVPISQYLQGFGEGTPMKLPKDQVLQGEIADVLQVDLLHPKLNACLALLLVSLERVQQAGWGLTDDQVRWSMPELKAEVLRLTEPKRQRALERRRHRAKLAGR